MKKTVFGLMIFVLSTGINFGQPRIWNIEKLTEEQLNEMKIDFNSGVAKTEIAKKYDVTRAYVYQLVGG